MSDKQMMIYGYIRTQFDTDRIQVTLKGDDQIIIDDGVEQMTLTSDERFNIIDSATGRIIARNTGIDWQNVPNAFRNASEA